MSHKFKQLKPGKYWIYGLFLIFVVLLLVWALFFRFSGNRAVLFQALPPTSGLIAGWPDAADFLRSSDSTAFEVALPQAVRRDLALYREVLELADTAGLGALLFFLQEGGPEGAALGAVLDPGDSGFDIAALQQGASGLRQTMYRNYAVHRLTMASGRSLVAAGHHNLLLLGRFPFLVEEVVGHLSRVNTNPVLSGAAADFAESGLSFWISGKTLNERWPGAGMLWPPGWLRLGWNRTAVEGMVEGAYFPREGKVFEQLSGTRNARPGSILQFIPEDMAWLEWIPVEASDERWEQEAVQADLLREHFEGVAGQEQALVVTRQHGPGGNADRFWMLPLQNPSDGAAALEELAGRVGVLEDYEYQTYRIRRLLSDQLSPPVKGLPSQVFENPYVVLLDEVLLLANSKSALELWIDQYLVNATLPFSESFINYYEHNDAPARTWWLARPAMLEASLRKDSLTRALIPLLQNFPYAGLQWRADQVNPQFSGIWPAGENAAAARPAFVWRTRLEAPVLRAPQQIKAPGVSSPLFLVQDEFYQLYLLGAEGGVRWREALPGPVLSDFHLIDYYGDGQGQLLFNTANAIHLLDLDRGGTVGNFPLRLQSEASNGLTVIDTTGAGGYAFFVACSNERIYGFNREGLPVPGWNPSDSVGAVRHPLLHFQETGKDFFVVLNEIGTLHVLKRNGTHRFPPVLFQDTFPSPPDYQLHPRSSRIVACNQDGVVQVLNLSGEHFPLPLRGSSERPVYFTFTDLLGDDRKDYLALSGSALTLHYYSSNDFRRAFRYRFDRRPDELFEVPVPGQNKSFAGLLDKDSQKIYLLDGEGKLHAGFPLAGSTPFCIADLYGNGKMSVIVGEGTSVYAYTVELDW